VGFSDGEDKQGLAPTTPGETLHLVPKQGRITWMDPATGHAMEATLARWEKAVPWIVPPTDPAHAAFEPLRYWRGPVWVVVNWMIANGFALAGQAKVADHILDRTVALIETCGLAEYFDPRTGRGLGGSDFSWTAAIYLMLSRGG
jgi:alpha,alpha-trehalase